MLSADEKDVDPVKELDEQLDGWATHHVGGTSTLKLEAEVTFGKEIKNEIVFRRPKGKQMRQLKGLRPGPEDLLRWASELSDLSPNQIDQLDAIDILRVMALLGRAFMTGPGTGAV